MRRALLDHLARARGRARRSVPIDPDHGDRTEALHDGPDLSTIDNAVSSACNAYRDEGDVQRKVQLREVWVALAFNQAHESSQEVADLLQLLALTKGVAMDKINEILSTSRAHVQDAVTVQSASTERGTGNLTALSIATALAREEVQRFSSLSRTITIQNTIQGVRVALDNFDSQAIEYGDRLLDRLHSCWSAVKRARATLNQQSLSKGSSSFSSFSRKREIYFS